MRISSQGGLTDMIVTLALAFALLCLIFSYYMICLYQDTMNRLDDMNQHLELLNDFLLSRQSGLLKDPEEDPADWWKS